MIGSHSRAPGRARLLTPVFLLVMLSTFAYFVSIGILVPTLPRFVEGPLGGGPAEVGIAIGFFSITAVLLRPLSGRVADRRGRRVLMLGGAALVAAATAGLAGASSLGAVLLLRLVTGVGEAGFYTGAASTINDVAPDDRRGEALSFFSLALYAGLAVGPVVGERILDAAGFDAVWVASAVAALVAVALSVRVSDTRPERDAGAASGRLLHANALLPGVVLATSVWGLSGFNTFVPLYALDIGLPGSDVVFVVYSSIVLALRSLGARIPDRLGAAATARWALGVSALGLAVMAAWDRPGGLYGGAALFAVGQALAFPALMTLAVRGAAAHERGAAVGTFTAFFDLAFGAGAASLGVVADALGYAGTFGAAAAIAVAGMALTPIAGRATAGRPAPAPRAVNEGTKRPDEATERPDERDESARAASGGPGV
ncbi:MAG TPA: MFS transporter [Actinomycetota bacterium]|nr:MFS transporter [Actinomycetota bacterium]